MEDINGIITSLKHGGDRTQADLRDIAAELQAASAAAVQAERGRCIETALNCFFDLTDTSTMSAPEVIKRTRYGIAAAIRARNGAGRE